MKLENQVTSLELSKRLKELGVKQDGIFWWVQHKNPVEDQTPRVEIGYDAYEHVYKILVSAFTVSELGEMLKSLYIGKEAPGKIIFPEYMPSIDKWCSYLYGNIEEKTEADARTKILIYLIENKFISL